MKAKQDTKQAQTRAQIQECDAFKTACNKTCNKRNKESDKKDKRNKRNKRNNRNKRNKRNKKDSKRKCKQLFKDHICFTKREARCLKLILKGKTVGENIKITNLSRSYS